MTTDEVLTAMANHPLCLSCLVKITAPMERDTLLALFACNIKSNVEMCVGCKRDTQTTYRFQVPQNYNRCGVTA